MDKDQVCIALPAVLACVRRTCCLPLGLRTSLGLTANPLPCCPAIRSAHSSAFGIDGFVPNDGVTHETTMHRPSLDQEERLTRRLPKSSRQRTTVAGDAAIKLWRR